MQGQLDTELTELGPRPGDHRGRGVGQKHQPLLVSGRRILRRAYDTAIELEERTGPAGSGSTHALRETHLGDWQGMTHNRDRRHRPGPPDWRGRDDAQGGHRNGRGRTGSTWRPRSVPLIAELVGR